MTVLPFVCLATGIILGLLIKVKSFSSWADKVMTVALVFLMLAIGAGIGLDESIIRNAFSIGFHCIVIALCAIFFSVILTVICEKTVLPLESLDSEIRNKHIPLDNLIDSKDVESSSNKGDGTKEKEGSHLVWIMPLSVILGLVLGILFRDSIRQSFIDGCFTGSLILLYICVGISQGTNREVFGYIKLLGLKIIWISVAILIGSIMGGLVSGMILGLPLHISTLSAGGMSFYSIAGAYMTDVYGLETGTYGFIVNIMREVFTIILLPLLKKISLGSPIAGGAAGDMDTMLAPITKFVGIRLGLVALITGTVLTFAVPIILPLLNSILNTML